MEGIKAVLKVLFDIGMGLDKSMADKKFDLADIGNFIALLADLGPAVKAAPTALKDWAALTASERAELVTWVGENFSIYDKHAEKQIEVGIKILVLCGEFLEKPAA